MHNPQVNGAAPPAAGAPVQALVVEFDPQTQLFRWRFGNGVPLAGIANTLSLIHSILMDNQKAQLQQVKAPDPSRVVTLADGTIPPESV